MAVRSLLTYVLIIYMLLFVIDELVFDTKQSWTILLHQTH